MKPSYLKLCTEFYDLTKPEALPRELAFYEALIRKAKGPVLEAMCGSGRLLLPLLKKGLVVEGVDSSLHMLESCKTRADKLGLKTALYHQSLHNLSLPHKYDLIFIAIGSFQLIYDLKEAFSILQKLLQALLPSAKLVLETSIPWDAIKDNVEGESLAKQSKEVTSERVASQLNHFTIVNTSKTAVYFDEQLIKIKTRYEKKVDRIVTQVEEEEYTIRWYYRLEMALFLEKAGFSSVDIVDASFEQNEQAILYIASPKRGA